MNSAVTAAAPAEAARLLSRLILQADVALDEKKMLCKLAGARSGAGSRVAERMVAEALAEQRATAARERRMSSMLASTKPRLPVPLPDAEAKPVMTTWDGILSSSGALEPPMRDVERWPVAIQQRETAGLHELTAAGSNDEEDVRTRLPSPKNFLLTKHDTYSLEIELSDHMTFIEETADGDRAVGAPYRLLTHWLKYRQSKLPTVRAVVTMPLVLPGGELLGGAGLDRDRGVVFRIDPALSKYIPERAACTPAAVGKAHAYLVDEWLTDVASDREGKAVLIAYALRRWRGLDDAEERRKALYAVLREGAPSLVFDNIPRGTVIGCPHIERASTAEVYKDRLLGVSEAPSAPAFTIIAFTGNNIRPKSDTASRSWLYTS